MRTATDIDAIKEAALDQRRLLELALLDAIEAFTAFMLHHRTPEESITLCGSWEGLFRRHAEMNEKKRRRR
jgi:hypothetical protein